MISQFALGISILALSSFLSLHAQSPDKDVVWTEDFEGDWSENWYVNIGTWEVGTPTSGPGGAYAGNNCAATALNGNYPETADSRLIRFTSFTVPPTSENPQLVFYHWWDFNGGDFGEVQVKTSNSDWKTISPRYTRYSNHPWYKAVADLSSYADSTVQIAFYFHSHSTDPFDPDVASGWYLDDVSLITGPDIFRDPEDFELGLGDWHVDMGTWNVGIPESGPFSSHSGDNCAGTTLSGDYFESVDSRLISPPFIIPAASEFPMLQFWHWWRFIGGDFGEVQIKTVQGTWKPLHPRYVLYSDNNWFRARIDLSPYADSLVQIAFYFHSHSTDPFGPDVAQGWYVDDISVVTGPYLTNNPEDFETGINDWMVDQGTWEIGTPAFGPDKAFGGDNCAGTNLNDNYYEFVQSRLISRPIKIPNATADPALRFRHWFKILSGDFGEVQLSTDMGASWQTITSQSFSGSSLSWSPFYIPLTNYADSVVQFGFLFQSNSTYPFGPDVDAGWYIDDIRIHDNSELVVYAGPDITLEECGANTIQSTITGGMEPYFVEWIPAEGLDDPTSLTPVASPSDTTLYTLKVTDANGCFRTDRVVINASCSAPNSETDILTFGFGKPPQSGDVIINADTHTIKCMVKYGTELTNLTTYFTLSEGAKASVDGIEQVSGITANDFSGPVTYRITAEDGITVQEWEVQLGVEEVAAPAFLLYSFGDPPQKGNAFIDADTGTVDIKVEHGTDMTNLVATFSLPEGASASVDGVIQQSGVTANDFTDPVLYTIIAADGITTREWTVTVIEAALYETDFLSFEFGIPPQLGASDIDPVSHSIEVEVEAGTDVTGLAATFTLSEGASVTVSGVLQETGVTVNDFTEPVTYSVLAADGETTQDWIVNVQVEQVIGMTQEKAYSMTVFPNPFSQRAMIEIHMPDQPEVVLSIYHITGKKVFEKHVGTSTEIELTKGALSSGVYTLVLTGADVNLRKMIIIE